jgi:hypothetical protein
MNLIAFALKTPWHPPCCLEIMQRASVHVSSPVGLFFASLMARIRAFIDRQVPIGYQDETGFHLGVQRPTGNPERF